MEEKELLQLLKSKDEKGFQILYRNYSDVIYGIIIRMLKDHDESADMLQEVFIRIWSKIDSYDPGRGRLFTWMSNLTRNFVIDRIRSADYKNHRLNYFVRDDRTTTVDKQYNVEQNINAIGLVGLVEDLKENQRVLLQKIYFEGYTQVDLAEELEIPLGTLKTRVRAALKELRKNFKQGNE